MIVLDVHLPQIIYCCKASCITDTTPHRFRKYFASLYLMKFSPLFQMKGIDTKVMYQFMYH